MDGARKAVKRIAILWLFASVAVANTQEGSLNTYNGEGSVVSSNNNTEEEIILNYDDYQEFLKWKQLNAELKKKEVATQIISLQY